MALWSTLGDPMLGSRWPESLKDAGIVNSLAAGMCLLKAVNVIKTRYAHQVTTAVLDILSCHRSSSLPIDHAHEQMNKKIKGVWWSHWSHGKSVNVREMDNCWPRTMQSS